MINLQNLVNNQSNGAGGGSTKDKAFYFDGTNDYITGNGNLGNGVAIAGSDGNGAYMQCYNTGFDIGPLSIDNRSVQTIKWRGSFDSFANTPVCFGYWGGSFTVSTISMVSNGKIQMEVQGTGSARIQTVNTFSINTEYNIIVRINNTLPSGTARVVGDVDIFVDGVKQTLGITTTGNSTVTASQAYRGAYSTTLGMTGKMRSLDIWNIALTDGQCGTEGVSSSVVNTTGYIKGFRPNDIHPNIGRAGYDLVAGGLVTSTSDGDGNCFLFNGNRNYTAVTGTPANINSATGATFTQAQSFTHKVRAKILDFPVNNYSGLYGNNFDATIGLSNNAGANRPQFTIRGSSQVDYVGPTQYTLNTLFDAYLVYDANTAKFYCYLSYSGATSTLLNTGGTAGPTTFTTADFNIGDNAYGGGNYSSNKKNIYHACTRCRALTQAEIDADIALGNATKTDKTIIAYFIPENFAYNTQFCTNPKDLSNASWAKGAVTTVTADYGTAPDGTTTADRVVRTGVGGVTANKVDTTFTTITGASLASKVLYVKAFVRAVGADCPLRLRCSHQGVADYYSGDFTATSTVQEFTFSQTFTSGTGGTGVTAGIVVDSAGNAVDIEVRNIRCRFGNEYLHDEAPNMSDLIGWKTPTVLSAKVQVATDPADVSDAGCALLVPWFYFHIRSGTLQPIARYDNALAGVQANAGALGAGYRVTFHIVAYKFWNGTNWSVKIYLNGVLIQTTTQSTTLRPPTTIYGNTAWLGRKGSTYFNSYIQRAKVHIPTSRVDGDAVKLYNGQEPANASKVLEYKPKANEAGLITKDRANNNNNGTLLGGVERRNF